MTATTPLMQQYEAAKRQVPNALLMFRLGDFYELFHQDAVVAARELDITLTARNKERGEPIPMCGVPYHSADNYISRLIQRGYRVAICEQMEEAGLGKKLVRREITRVVTPGTATGSDLVRARENTYLAAVFSRGDNSGLAYADLSTGEFRTTELATDELAATVEALSIREVLYPENEAPQLGTNGRCLQTALEPWIFGGDQAGRTLLETFRLLSLDGCGLGGRSLATSAAGAVVHYLRETQKSALTHLNRPSFYQRAESMVLDGATVRNLELLEPLFAGESREGTLISVIDRTETGAGGRLLRRRLLSPCCERTEIEARLDAVAELAAKTIVRGQIRKVLGQTGDLERLLSRMTLGLGSARDLLALGKTLACLPEIQALRESLKAPVLKNELPLAAELRDSILASISDSPPADIADGGTIRTGVSAELDELRALSQNSRQVIAAIEARERGASGIASLKVRFNNVFGFYIEVSKANLQLVPPNYQRKQTLANAERFTTSELKELEEKVLTAEERILGLEREIFVQLRDRVSSFSEDIKISARTIAEIDVTAALAQVAVDNRYRRPQFSDDGEMRIEGGRHPVVEKLLEKESTRFVPNDIYLHSDREFIGVITGPNMGGKSTYLRQAALTCVLAQTGSFVPADAAVLPVVDRVFTRIGAADNLARGRSTFMVEMTEAAAILHTATSHSFLILDEIGRGTSTFDGLSLAWAIAEHIHNHIRAKTLFATHYHELTELTSELSGIRNLHVAVKEVDDRILFIRKVEPGTANRSYGIEVARLAGLPVQVIERARSVLLHHEVREHSLTKELTPGEADKPIQIKLFEPVNQGFADRVRSLDINQLRPVEALQILQELQQELLKR